MPSLKWRPGAAMPKSRSTLVSFSVKNSSGAASAYSQRAVL
jgi:hypothetical protein